MDYTDCSGERVCVCIQEYMCMYVCVTTISKKNEAMNLKDSKEVGFRVYERI